MTGPDQISWRAQIFWAAGIWALGTVLLFVLGLTYGTDEAILGAFWALIAMGKLVAIRVLWMRGTFRNPPIWRVAALSITIMLFGVLFKIQHWPLADALLILSIAALVITYTAHYALKARKRLSDHLKAAWVIVNFSAALIRVEHWSTIANELNYLAIALFWCMVIAYMREQRNAAPGQA